MNRIDLNVFFDFFKIKENVSDTTKQSKLVDFNKITNQNYSPQDSLESIKSKFSESPSYKLTSEELQNVKKVLNTQIGKSPSHLLSLLPNECIVQVIENGLNAKSININQIQPLFQEILSIFTDTKLEALLGLNSETVNKTLTMQACLKDEALNSVLKTKGKAIWKELSTEAFYFGHDFIQTVISLTGLMDVNYSNPKSHYRMQSMGAYEAKSKMDLYFGFFKSLSVIFISSYALFNSVLVATFLTWIAVSALLISIPLYLRFLKPCPNKSQGLENSNTKAIQNEGDPLHPRMDILTQIQNIFASGKGVILTADPGEGKNSIIETLALLIALEQCHKNLKGVQVFSTNANALNLLGDGDISFNGIENTFKRNEQKIILFIDEAHNLFKDNLIGGKLSEKLLTFKNKFPYVICATTNQQYKEIMEKEGKEKPTKKAEKNFVHAEEAFDPIANKDKKENKEQKNEASFTRRFTRIQLPPLKENEIEIILNNKLHHKAPELIVEEGAIQHIMKKAHLFFPDTAKVDAASSLLSGVIIRASFLSFEALELEINELELERTSLSQKLIHGQKFDGETMTKFDTLSDLISKKKNQLEHNQEQLIKIKQIEKDSLRLRMLSFELAEKTPSPQLKRKWLENQVNYKILSDYIMKKREELGLPPGLTKNLIDEVAQGYSLR